MENIFKKYKSLLYSYSDWNKIARDNPTLEIEKQGQVFYYFGSNHSRDPKNEQYLRLRKYWGGFATKTQGTNHVVLIEGGIRNLDINEEEAIKKESEAGLVTLWASILNIPVYSPEPKRSEEYSYLLKEFNKEEIAYYYFARVVNQWHRHIENIPEFESYIDKFLKADQNAAKWDDFYYFSIEGMKAVHRKIFKKDLSKEDKEFFAHIVDPTRNDSIINKVPRELSLFRDTTIVEGIIKHWQEGENIFAVFGSGHVIVQDRALKVLLK